MDFIANCPKCFKNYYEDICHNDKSPVKFTAHSICCKLISLHADATETLLCQFFIKRSARVTEKESHNKKTCNWLQIQLETAHGLVFLFSSVNFRRDQSYQLYSIKTSSHFQIDQFKQRPKLNGSKRDGKIILTNFIHLVLYRHHTSHTSFAFHWRATIKKCNLQNVVPSILHNELIHLAL